MGHPTVLLLTVATGWTVVASGTRLPPHRAAVREEATETWGGTLNWPGGVANNVPMNLSVVRSGTDATAEVAWVYDHDNSGHPCVKHIQSGMKWTENATWAEAVGQGTDSDFYTLAGKIETTVRGHNEVASTRFIGSVINPQGQAKGSFSLTLGAPQVASTCHGPPSPPPPPPPPPIGPPGNAKVWPMPRDMQRGTRRAWVDSHAFRFSVVGNTSTVPELDAAFVRFRPLYFTHVAAGSVPTPSLTLLEVRVDRPGDALAFGVDETYNLTVPAPDSGSSGTVTVQAVTVFGAYHAMESFLQLLQFDFENEVYAIQEVPVTIHDGPRFPWRELMLDTSRHWLPPMVIRSVIDSMLTAKLNVLHLHLVDSQAFPLILPSAPKLVDGAYSSMERYRLADLQMLQQYAQARGVRVVAEIDTPGHGASWCTGRPDICPTATCHEPLDVSNNATFDTIANVWKDLFSVFPDPFVHLGGDEVDTSCWSSTPRIAAWMQSRGITADQAYEYFVQRTQAIAHGAGKTTLVWDEIWDHFGTALDRETTVINTRFNPSQAPVRTPCVANATSHGYRVVRSQNVHWYLDQTVNKPWTAQYSFDVCGDIPASSCQYVLGGAASMWGETVDSSDLMQTVWPRAGAVGERLWSPAAVNDSTKALPRYLAFRCYLNRRGFTAAPALNGQSAASALSALALTEEARVGIPGQGAADRQGPHGPGSCFAQ